MKNPRHPTPTRPSVSPRRARTTRPPRSPRPLHRRPRPVRADRPIAGRPFSQCSPRSRSSRSCCSVRRSSARNRPPRRRRPLRHRVRRRALRPRFRSRSRRGPRHQARRRPRRPRRRPQPPQAHRARRRGHRRQRQPPRRLRRRRPEEEPAATWPPAMVGRDRRCLAAGLARRIAHDRLAALLPRPVDAIAVVLKIGGRLEALTAVGASQVLHRGMLLSRASTRCIRGASATHAHLPRREATMGANASIAPAGSAT